MDRRPIRACYDVEEIGQVAKIAIHIAESQHPGDRGHGKHRARQAIARYRIKERRWFDVRVPLSRVIGGVDEDRRRFELILVREILDLLPYTVRDEVLTALLSNDGKRINRAGRLVREALPHITKGE